IEQPPITVWRSIVIASYGVLKSCFWVALVFFILKKAATLYGTASVTISSFLSMALAGLKAADAALVASSLIRLLFFVLMILTVSSLIGNLAVKVGQLARRAAAKLPIRHMAKRIIGPARG
ncbi:MAG: hypothetical protein DMF60_20475, partial [Acidobacteria bacterium]